MNEAPVREGDVLAGKYQVERVLGVGGMGVVVAAWHLQLDERVAIKFLLPEALANGEAVGRFAREARAAVKIKGEHVARVIDVGNLENGAPYMVMEYLDGGDLAGVLQQRGRLPLDEALEYVLQACEAIAEAHALGIVHRDLKPANLFVTRRPDGSSTVKVLDFGISKTMTRAASSRPEQALTRTSTIMGSPLYMSPEQMASTRDVDGRTDIWALGAILYELLTGNPPFVGDTMPQLCAAILQSSPVPLRPVRPDVPPPLESLILRCLEKDRQRRPAHIAELAVGLAPFAPARVHIAVDRIVKMQHAAGITGQRDAGAMALGGGAAGTGAAGTSASQAGSGYAVPGAAGAGAGAAGGVGPAGATGPQVFARPLEGPGGSTALAPETMANWAESRAEKKSPRRNVAIGLGAIGVLAGVSAAVVLLRFAHPHADTAAANPTATQSVPLPDAAELAAHPVEPARRADEPAAAAGSAKPAGSSEAELAEPTVTAENAEAAVSPAAASSAAAAALHGHVRGGGNAHGARKHARSATSASAHGTTPSGAAPPVSNTSLFDDRK